MRPVHHYYPSCMLNSDARPNPCSILLLYCLYATQTEGTKLERRLSAREMEASDELLTALESCNIDNVRSAVSRIPQEGLKTALTTPSLLIKHNLRTPLMAAAATRDFSIFTVITHALDRQFPLKVSV